MKTADFEKAFGLSKLFKAGKFEELLTASEALPTELRKERFVQFLRVQAARNLGDDPRYIKALDELAAAFPKDPSVDFILLDRHFLNKDFKQALRSVDELTRQLGNDAFLANLQAMSLIALNQLDDAEAAISAGLEVEPDDFDLQMSRIDLLAKKKDHAEIRIRDSGTGIAESARGKIFDPFFTTKGVGKGTGQGLYIAHTVVVKKHGGTLAFETEIGKGTTFIIRLPLTARSA